MARAIPLFDTEMLLDESEAPCAGDASVEDAMAGTEALVDLPDESDSVRADATHRAPDSMHDGDAEIHDAADRSSERPPRDTAELVAQDGSGRATDEIVAVPSEIIDEETKRSLRLEFALHEDEAPDTWLEAPAPVPRDDLSTEPLTPLAGSMQAAGDDARDSSHASGSELVTPGEGAVQSGAAPAETVEPARVDAMRSSDEVTAETAAETTAETTAERTHGGDGAPSIDALESISDAEFTASGESRDIDLLDELTPPFMREGAEDLATGHTGGVAARSEDAMASALDVQALRALVEGRDGAEHAADGGEHDHADGIDDGAENETSAELPLLEVEGAGDEETDLGIAPYNVEEDTPVTFLAGSDDADEALSPDDGVDRESPAGARGPAGRADEASPDEWAEDEVPEVLIDGEWRDEHMGDLVSGEVRAIRSRPEEAPRRPIVRFDDLAAATLWVSPDDLSPGSRRTPAAGAAYHAHLHTPRSTLSLGGVEAQLRRRLELDPGNVELRRQLGETLLDQGDREAGFAELDAAMQAYEQAGNLDSARGVADVVLRVNPSSVRHHQKRVEYAVRLGDRVRLVEAYVELADALFRSGDPDKARVVYGRVLDLAPGNERARFALGLLAPEEMATANTQAAVTPPEPPDSSGSVADLFDRAARASVDATVGHVETSPSDSGIADSSAEAATDRADPASGGEFELGPATPTLDEQIDAAFATPAGAEPGVSIGDEPLSPAAPQAAIGDEQDASSLATKSVSASDRVGSGDSSPVPLAAERGDEGEGDFIDLGSWLYEDVPARSTRMITVEATPTGDEQADFDEMLRRFKQGVAANVDEEDYASHYDLGVAYKEMGLVDEAIAEFQKSLRGETHRVRSYEALGQCFVEKGQLQVAVTLLRRALETTGADDQQLVGVLYLLGYASEIMARHAESLGYYQRVFAIDIEFRDVAQRVAAMEQVTQ
ncbi:MAG: tetratricopeptide repeat protein [Gemmatimonadota bacterium]